MGGPGSGRHYHCGSKSTTDDYRSLDIRRLQRDGLLKPGQAFSWQWSRNGEKVASIQVRTEINRIILSYKHRSGSEEWQDKEYPVRLDWTSCNYGGQRAWFLCPAAGCGRRLAVLYSGGIFACRHCYRLAYESQRENTVDLMARRANKIRARLGWDAGILNSTGQKPKGMRWQSYWQLCREYETSAQIAFNEIAHKFGFLKNRGE